MSHEQPRLDRIAIEAKGLHEHGSDRQLEMAEKFLSEYPSDLKSTPEFAVLDLAVLNGLGDAQAVVLRGRKMIQQGIREKAVYEILIPRLREIGHTDQAEQLEIEAKKLS